MMKQKFNDYCIHVGDHGWKSVKTMKAALTNAEKEVQKLKKDGGHTGAGGQPQYSESQKLVYELYFSNKPNETTTVIYKDLINAPHLEILIYVK